MTKVSLFWDSTKSNPFPFEPWSNFCEAHPVHRTVYDMIPLFRKYNASLGKDKDGKFYLNFVEDADLVRFVLEWS